MIVNFPPVAVGDHRKIAVSLQASDAAAGLTVASATYTLSLRGGNSNPIVNAGVCTVAMDSAGIRIYTPLTTFPTVGTYVCDFAITWSDGVIDNTVQAEITVQAIDS